MPQDKIFSCMSGYQYNYHSRIAIEPVAAFMSLVYDAYVPVRPQVLPPQDFPTACVKGFVAIIKMNTRVKMKPKLQKL